MVIDRRTILLGSCSLLAGAGAAWADKKATVFFAAARKGADGNYSAAIFTADGRDVRAVPLPDRGHDITACPVTRRCVVFARRPGNFAIAFSADRSAPPISFSTPDDRHFYGHGVFSRDGRLLYATENDFENARGIIGVYDVAANFKRIGEFPSYGIGPHDLAFLHGQPVVVIANGGLIEHPDFGRGRRVLNPDAIETSLAYVDVRTGDLLERHVLSRTEQLSLRHLDIGRDNTVVLGGQLQTKTRNGHALVYKHRREQELSAFGLADEIVNRFSGYISSVAVDASGEMAAVTSSRGAVATMIDIASGTVVRSVTCRDVSGISPSAVPKAFLVTSGDGLIGQASNDGFVQSAETPWLWDNHAIMVLNG